MWNCLLAFFNWRGLTFLLGLGCCALQLCKPPFTAFGTCGCLNSSVDFFSQGRFTTVWKDYRFFMLQCRLICKAGKSCHICKNYCGWWRVWKRRKELISELSSGYNGERFVIGVLHKYCTFYKGLLGLDAVIYNIVTGFRDRINFYAFFHSNFYTGNQAYKAPFVLPLVPSSVGHTY